MRMMLLMLALTTMLITGGGTKNLSQPSPHFVHFPPNPSSIVVTKYLNSRSLSGTPLSTSILTGTRMKSLYTALEKVAKHAAGTVSMKCPNPPVKSVAFDYRILIKYPNHKSLTFTQKTVACTLIYDDQTGYVAVGPLLSLPPFGVETG